MKNGVNTTPHSQYKNAVIQLITARKYIDIFCIRTRSLLHMISETPNTRKNNVRKMSFVIRKLPSVLSMK